MVSQDLCLINLAFEGQPFRTLLRDGETWFVLADVCQALELSDVSMTASRLDPDEKDTSIIGTLGGRQEMLIISEPGFYNVTRTSRKPVAARLRRFVDHEVLPSIRKTGAYSLPGPQNDLLEQLGPIVRTEVRKEMDPVVREMRAGFKQIGDNVYELAAKGRKDATAETVRMHGKVIRYHYYKKCPCLECSITIMDDDGFIDGAWHHHHQFNHSNNRLTAMIPLAVACHKRIENDPEARTRFGAKAWVQFQSLLERLPATQTRFDF